MAKINPAAITQKMYALLKDLKPEERQTVVAATLTLFGESSPTANPTLAQPVPGIITSKPAAAIDGLRAFFDSKQPKTKIEQFAVAARYREQHEGAAKHTKDDFKAAFSAAKRAFDHRNFHRDLSNAKTAKFFNTGVDNQLSYYGEQYVDALPDRQAAAAIKRPGSLKRRAKPTPRKAAK